ncbi:MAG TPA: branched-chain amino acid ABC transporter permease [Ilumatobacteraceae bacterium]|nr:branched-chain amino acid ABC transporter permease [Ilumatobacteraceae bacterium]
MTAALQKRFRPAENLPLLFLGAALVPITILLIIEAITDPTQFFQTLMKALALGSVYAIIALGFVLIFKATQTVNFSQGALGMAGALFLSFLIVDDHIPFTTVKNPIASIEPHWLAWILSVVVALVFVALLGLVIERLTIRPMIGEPLFSVAVITLGLEIVLRVFAIDTVKIQFRSLAVPWGNRSFSIGGADINWSYIAAMATAAMAFVAVYFFYRSRMGIAMRAVAQDQEAAMAQGINIGRVFAIAWAAGAVLAAIGSIFAVQPPVKQTGSVDQETVFVAFRALPAVILGGLDSVQGALVGGLLVGLAEIYAGQYLSGQTDILGAGYPVIVPYIVMIIGLLVRPYGLFGTPEIRRV